MQKLEGIGSGSDTTISDSQAQDSSKKMHLAREKQTQWHMAEPGRMERGFDVRMSLSNSTERNTWRLQ